MTPDTFTIAVDNETEVQSEEIHEHDSLRQCTEHALKHFFECLDGQMTTDLYELVITEVEQPLLELTMAYTRNNQSKTAEILGLNRGTLRKKLKQYNLL